MKNRIEMFEHAGKRFIYYDLSYFGNNTEFELFTSLAKEMISAYPPDGSLLSITNIEGVVYDSETKDIIARWMRYNRPYIRYGAIIGLDGIKKIMVNSILKMCGRKNMKFFHTRQEAVEWLSMH